MARATDNPTPRTRTLKKAQVPQDEQPQAETPQPQAQEPTTPQPDLRCPLTKQCHRKCEHKELHLEFQSCLSRPCLWPRSGSVMCKKEPAPIVTATGKKA